MIMPDTPLPPAAIFDLDGTLSSCKWRLPLVEAKNWKGFYGGLSCDAPVPRVAEMLRAVLEGTVRLLVSGRPDNYRYATQWWLAEHDLPYDELHMRSSGDYRPDQIVKAEIADQLERRLRIVSVVDDRPRVCDMWEARRLPLIRVVDPGLPPIVRDPEDPNWQRYEQLALSFAASSE